MKRAKAAKAAVGEALLATLGRAAQACLVQARLARHWRKVVKRKARKVKRMREQGRLISDP